MDAITPIIAAYGGIYAAIVAFLQHTDSLNAKSQFNNSGSLINQMGLVERIAEVMHSAGSDPVILGWQQKALPLELS